MQEWETRYLQWSLGFRLLCSPVLLVYFAIRIFCCKCIAVYFNRAMRACLRPIFRVVCCGACLTHTDKSFPAGPSSLGAELSAQFPNIQWKRADALIGGVPEGKHFHLFSEGVSTDDVKQGAVGDCWLVAAMSTLAGSMPGAIRKLFCNAEYSSRGRYRIRLFDVKTNAWIILTIDDKIPTRDGREPLFAKPNGDELWVLLLEKAIAKYCGSYSAISGGFEAWGLKVLTGNNVFTFRKKGGEWRRYEFVFKPTDENAREAGTRRTTESHGSDGFWRILRNYSADEKGAMCCTIAGKTVEGKRPDGLVELHAYSLLRAVEVQGVKLLQIRNPWGAHGEWNGAWSDGSKEWRNSPIVRTTLGYKESDDGTFWMCWEDFDRVWSEITVCDHSVDTSDLALDVHEEMGCPGPCVGLLGGCARYWCLCQGCKATICPHRSSARTDTSAGCCGSLC